MIIFNFRIFAAYEYPLAYLDRLLRFFPFGVQQKQK
jgi:hypothetical protein